MGKAPAVTDLIAVLSTGPRLADDAMDLGVQVSRSMGLPLVLIDGTYAPRPTPTLRHRIDHLAIKRAARQAELSQLETDLRNSGVPLTVLHSDGLTSDEPLEVPGLAFVADPRGRHWPRRDPFDRLRSVASTVVLVRRRPPRRTAVIVRPAGAPVSDPPAFLAALGLETVTVRCAGPFEVPDPLRRSMSSRDVERLVGSIKPSFVIVEGDGAGSRQVLGRMLATRYLNVGWVPAPRLRHGAEAEEASELLRVR